MKRPEQTSKTRTSHNLGITLVEVLVVVVIIALVSAVVFGVQIEARRYANRGRCLSNLHRLGLAMAIYRADWADQNPPDKVLPGPPKERQAWVLLNQYMLSKEAFSCPEEGGTSLDSLGYFYRSGPRSVTTKDTSPLGLEPSSITAYCMEHLRKKVVHGPFTYTEYERDETNRYSGRFQFLRADGSTATCDAKQVETWTYDGKQWYKLAETPKGTTTYLETQKFPDEPWPPQFQP